MAMAQALSNLVLKSISRSTCPIRQAVATDVPGLIRRYSKLPGDSDTHEDFLPNSKTTDSNHSLKGIVEQDIKDNPVMIYMKGHPDAPRCGFSALAVRVLKEYGVPLSARNILEDQELKNSVKTLSHWPTFPQIFIKGEFIGGSDIILDMHKNGELKEKLKDVAVHGKE